MLLRVRHQWTQILLIGGGRADPSRPKGRHGLFDESLLPVHVDKEGFRLETSAAVEAEEVHSQSADDPALKRLWIRNVVSDVATSYRTWGNTWSYWTDWSHWTTCNPTIARLSLPINLLRSDLLAHKAAWVALTRHARNGGGLQQLVRCPARAHHSLKSIKTFKIFWQVCFF